MRPGPTVSPETCGWMTQRNCALICKWRGYASLTARPISPCKCCCTGRLLQSCSFPQGSYKIVNLLSILATERQAWKWSRWCLALLWSKGPASTRPTWTWQPLSSNGWKTWTIHQLMLICSKRRTFRGTPKPLQSGQQLRKMLLLIKVFWNQRWDTLLTERNYHNISPCNVMLRGAEISRCSAVAGDVTPLRSGRAELSRAAADRRSTHCGRNAGSCGKTHRVPVFGWNIA